MSVKAGISSIIQSHYTLFIYSKQYVVSDIKLVNHCMGKSGIIEPLG